MILSSVFVASRTLHVTSLTDKVESRKSPSRDHTNRLEKLNGYRHPRTLRKNMSQLQNVTEYLCIAREAFLDQTGGKGRNEHCRE